MSWKISYLLFILLAWSCNKDKISDTLTGDFVSIIDAVELDNIYNNQNVKLIDFRKYEDYNNGHIPGALNIWRNDIENDLYPYKGVMASKQQVEELFRELGIETEDTIIVYDDRGMCEASRLWWILYNYDFKKIKLLNGGFSAWKKINGQTDTIKPTLERTNFELSSSPSMALYVSKDKLQEKLQSNIKIIDTRTIEEYSGEVIKNGAKRAGRIPGSIHLDWSRTINFDGDKKLKPVEDLKTIFKKLEIKKTDSIILYCHSGVRSAHTTFVLNEIMGYKNVMNYDGSWTEWSHFNDLPIENGLVSLNKN